MKKILLPLFLFSIVVVSCNTFTNSIEGNGNITEESRPVVEASGIEAAGNFNIVLIKGEDRSLLIKTDENLFPYIVTEKDGNKLSIHPKKGYNLRPSNKIIVTVTTPELSEIELSGSCDLRGQGKFSGSHDLDIALAGTGNIALDINYPEVESRISGSGKITLTGETRESKIKIAGVGNYNAKDLKSEDVKIDIAGSGNASVFASTNLNINIAGSGDVNYVGNPQITQSIAGSGKITKD